jgi:osmotically-inducible protein OsmY
MRIHSREATSGPTIELKEDLAMSTIEIDKELRQGRRRWLGSKSSTNRLRALVAAFILAAALPGCAAFPQSSDPAVDQKITADVEARFRQHPELEAPDLIDVQTINRVVYLNGTVSAGLQREYAESVASRAPGVTKVVNSISVTR